MDKERKRKHLTLMHELDVKKVMIDIDYLDVLVDSCDKRPVLEMLTARNGLQLLSDKERITPAQFVTTNRRLEEMGNKFKNKCDCKKYNYKI